MKRLTATSSRLFSLDWNKKAGKAVPLLERGIIVMNKRTQIRDSRIGQLGVRLVILSLLFSGVAGCATAGTQPVDPTTSAPPVAATQPVDPTATPPAVEATLPSGWESYTNQGQCGYAISHPADMEGASQDTYSWILNYATTEPSGPFPNFLYVSVIPADFQGGGGEIYNYDPAETQTLLSLQVGESKPLREDPNIAPSFTYTRLMDTTLGNQAAQTYENTQPWEFPPGTKEIRYYLQGNGCTYLIGGYLATVGSGEPGTIGQELFDEIIATFQVNP
jgi:hypothetical protein